MHDKAAIIRFARKNGIEESIRTFSSPNLPKSAKKELADLKILVNGKPNRDRILALAVSPY